MTCFNASLSEQLLLIVTGASGRAGFLRTTPKRSKCPRPSISSGLEEGAAFAQGVASCCEAIVNSIDASPHGACEQNMWI